MSLLGRARADDAPAASAPTSQPPEAGPEPEAPAPSDSCPGERFVVLTFASDVESHFAAEVRTDLATELAHRGLSLCAPGATTRTPAALLTLRVEGMLVIIELDDRLTDKRVMRELTLSEIPANGRALATAIAIDELLRASWAELDLGGAVQEDGAVPLPDGRGAIAPVPATTLSPRKRARRRTRVALGAELGYARTPHDYDAFSLGLRATVRPRWAFLSLAVAPLTSIATHGPYGDVRARGVGTSLTLGACAEGTPRVFGCAGARAGLDWLDLRGSDARMADARSGRTAVVHTSGVALLGVRLSERLHLFGDVALGKLVRGARATDGTRTLMGVTGLLLSFRLGVGVEL